MFIPFDSLRAGQVARSRTDVWAYIIPSALVAGSLVDGRMGAWALRAPAMSLPVTKEPERSGGWPGRRSGAWGPGGSGTEHWQDPQGA